MKARRHKRFEINLMGKCMRNSVMFMALSFFFCIAYYFGIRNISDLGFGAAFFCGIVPLLITGAYIVFVYVLNWNAPGVYGLLAAGYCVTLILGSLFTTGVIQILLTLVLGGAAACVVILTTGGHLGSRSFCTALFLGCMVIRVLFALFGSIGLFAWVAEISVFAALAGFAFLPYAIAVRIE